jgi:leucyl aminopeptidase (aminopeptidase T)
MAAVTVLTVGFAPQNVTTPTGAGTTANNPKLANTLVTTCGGIRPNEIVWIEGGTRDAELLENLAVECRKIGAQPFITLGSDRLTKMMYTDVPAKFDAQEPTFALKLAETIDAVISIDYMEHPALLADIDPQRVMTVTKTHEAVNKKMLARNVVNVHLGNDLYPTKTRAERFGISQPELAKIFWNGVNVDYKQLQIIGANVQKKLANCKTVRITAPNGTDLTVQITQRPVFVSDGVVSYDDRTSGGPATQVWLPAGEVYVTPVPNTATGTFIADHFDYEGKHIEGLTLKFENGKLTNFTAKGDLSALKKHYDAAPAGKELFAAIDLGINPNVTVPANSTMTTWMGAGTISIGFGNNVWAGGDNTCPFDVFARLCNGTLTVDGTKLIENGKLLEK